MAIEGMGMDASTFWATGDYGIVGDMWAAPGRDLVAALEVRGRDAVDLATGTGVTALTLAREGAASVVGVDISPGLLAEAARRAAAERLDVRWLEADVVDVPLPSDCADVVTSTFGLVFADHPERAVAEARRLVRDGGDVVFTSWSPNGLFGDIRRLMSRYHPDVPAPWHESVAGIRDVAGAGATVEEREFDLVFESPEAFVHLMEQYSAPILMARRTLGEQWSAARAAVLSAVRSSATPGAAGYVCRVPYWVTTL